MSFFDYLFDNEYQQRSDINGLKEQLASKQTGERRRARALKQLTERVADLEQEVSVLALICRGLLTHLREANVVVPEELEAVFHRIDAQDGVVDGRVTPASEQPKQPKVVVAPKPRRKKR